MNVADIREYCLKKKGVTEEFPFDKETLVFKVMGKMFLLTNINDADVSVNLKCNAGKAIELRERYTSVQPGYHMNKTYWNTVTWLDEFSENEFYEMIDHSYDEVVNGLTGKLQKELGDIQ
jgi:predicted DNA-binding protein (MmcQ/YjbR family)